jgi:hypothetical protein
MGLVRAEMPIRVGRARDAIEVERVVALAMPTAANVDCCRRPHQKSRFTLNIRNNHEPVILIPIAVELVVMFQFEIAFFKPYFFR